MQPEQPNVPIQEQPDKMAQFGSIPRKSTYIGVFNKNKGKRKMRTERRMVKAKSQNEEDIIQFLKKKRKYEDYNYEDFKANYLGSIPYKNVTDDDIRYFYNIYKSVNRITEISLPKGYCTKPLVITFVGTHDTNFITTDSLYLNFLCDKTYYNYANTSVSIKELLKEACTLKDVTVASVAPFEIKEAPNIREYYFVDFNENYSSPMWRPVDQIEINKVKDIQSFFIDDIEYYCFLYEGVAVFCKKSVYDAENGALTVLTAINNSTTVYEDKGLRKGLKAFNYRTGSYYIQKTLDPTFFAPGVLCALPHSMCKYYFRCHLNIDRYVTYCINKNEKKFIDLKLLTFNNFNQLDEMIKILEVTSPDLINANGLQGYVDIMKDHTSDIKIIKKLFLSVQKVVYLFLNAFSKRINVDKLMEIKKLAEKAYNYAVEIEPSVQESFDKAIGSLAKLFISSTMHKFNTTFAKQVLNMIMKCCDMALYPSAVSRNMVDEIRALGFFLFDKLPTGTDPMFEEDIISPCAFLENVYGDLSQNRLETILEDLKIKVIDKLQADITEDQKSKSLLDQGYRKGLLSSIRRQFGDQIANELENKATNEIEVYLSTNLKANPPRKVGNEWKRLLDYIKSKYYSKSIDYPSIINGKNNSDVFQVFMSPREIKYLSESGQLAQDPLYTQIVLPLWKSIPLDKRKRMLGRLIEDQNEINLLANNDYGITLIWEAIGNDVMGNNLPSNRAIEFKKAFLTALEQTANIKDTPALKDLLYVGRKRNEFPENVVAIYDKGPNEEEIATTVIKNDRGKPIDTIFDVEMQDASYRPSQETLQKAEEENKKFLSKITKKQKEKLKQEYEDLISPEKEEEEFAKMQDYLQKTYKDVSKENIAKVLKKIEPVSITKKNEEEKKKKEDEIKKKDEEIKIKREMERIKEEERRKKLEEDRKIALQKALEEKKQKEEEEARRKREVVKRKDPNAKGSIVVDKGLVLPAIPEDVIRHIFETDYLTKKEDQTLIKAKIRDRIRAFLLDIIVKIILWNEQISDETIYKILNSYYTDFIPLFYYLLTSTHDEPDFFLSFINKIKKLNTKLYPLPVISRNITNIRRALGNISDVKSKAVRMKDNYVNPKTEGLFNSYSMIASAPLLRESNILEGTTPQYIDGNMPKDINDLEKKYQFNDLIFQ